MLDAAAPAGGGHRGTPGEQPLPRWMGPAYGAAYFGTTIVTQAFANWTVYAYAPPAEGGLTPYVPVALVGVALLAGRIVDALADPLVGVWSDNTRSPWGRRIPFMAVGAPLLALTFALLWTPPVEGESMANFYYLAAMNSAMLLFFTVAVAPYLALLPELTRSPKERVWLASWQAVYTVAGVGVAVVGAGIIIDAMGVPAMGRILAVIILASFLVTIFTVRGRELQTEPAGMGLVESIRLTLQNRPYVIFVASQVLFWFGFNIVQATLPYFVTVIMGRSEDDAGYLMGIAMAVAVVVIPLINPVVARIGLRGAFLGTMGVLAAVLGLMYGIGLYPAGTSFAHGAVLLGMAGIPLAGLFTLPAALTAEVIDLDEKRTGKRREAIYYGVAGFVQKAGLGFSALVVTGLLNTFGYSAANPMGIRLSGLTASAFVILGIIIFYRYPLGRPAPLPGPRPVTERK